MLPVCCLCVADVQGEKFSRSLYSHKILFLVHNIVMNMVFVHVSILAFILFDLSGISATVLAQEGGSLKSDQDFYENVDTFFDPKADYAHFPGRVSDKDSSGNILKVSTENMNARFFRAGDVVTFDVPSVKHASDRCEGYVRDTEPGYFVVYVKDFYPCWGKDDYFRRGTQLNFEAATLAQRVKDAAVYRVLLLKRKRDFLRQLNDLNHFVWSYDQQKVQVAANFDQKIIEVNKKKMEALDSLAAKKKDQLLIQKGLVKKLDEIDRDIDFYRIEKKELLVDRWNSDHDLGLPVGHRPQPMKPID